jgi:hypothetical protein
VRHSAGAQVHTGTYRFVRVRHADQKADPWRGGEGSGSTVDYPSVRSQHWVLPQSFEATHT